MNKRQRQLLPLIQLIIIGFFIFMAIASGESSHMSTGYSPSTYSGSSSSSSKSNTSSNPLLNTLCRKKGMAYQKSANARNAGQCEQYCNMHRYGSSCWDQGTQTCWCR